MLMMATDESSGNYRQEGDASDKAASRLRKHRWKTIILEKQKCGSNKNVFFWKLVWLPSRSHLCIFGSYRSK